MNRRISLFRPNQRKGGERVGGEAAGSERLSLLMASVFWVKSPVYMLRVKTDLRRIVSLKQVCLRSVEHTRESCPVGTDSQGPVSLGRVPATRIKGFCAARSAQQALVGASARPRAGGFQEAQPVAAPGPGDAHRCCLVRGLGRADPSGLWRLQAELSQVMHGSVTGPQSKPCTPTLA